MSKSKSNYETLGCFPQILTNIMFSPNTQLLMRISSISKINAPWNPIVLVTHKIHLSQEKSLKSSKIHSM